VRRRCHEDDRHLLEQNEKQNYGNAVEQDIGKMMTAGI
jgi:hypothetical protein